MPPARLARPPSSAVPAKRLEFREVDARHSSAAFRQEVQAGLEVLRKSKSPVGRATFEAITRGGVRIDELTDLNREDFARVRKTLASFGSRVGADEYARLHEGKGHAFRAITQNLEGYEWDDRIYVPRGMPPSQLAKALVHEVNHVLNQSEEHYRGDTQALREEYRAFYAEKLFQGVKMTPAECQKLKASIVRDYGLPKARVAEIPDVPPGVLVPKGRWKTG